MNEFRHTDYRAAPSGAALFFAFLSGVAIGGALVLGSLLLR